MMELYLPLFGLATLWLLLGGVIAITIRAELRLFPKSKYFIPGGPYDVFSR
jgi:hypothetical protein